MWREFPDNSGLDDDLAVVWHRVLTIPVVALLQGNSITILNLMSIASAEVAPRGDVERLLQALNRLLSEAIRLKKSASHTEGELAIRSALNSLAHQVGDVVDIAVPITAIATFLNTKERALFKLYRFEE